MDYAVNRLGATASTDRLMRVAAQIVQPTGALEAQIDEALAPVAEDIASDPWKYLEAINGITVACLSADERSAVSLAQGLGLCLLQRHPLPFRPLGCEGRVVKLVAHGVRCALGDQVAGEAAICSRASTAAGATRSSCRASTSK
jgi:hypothetical protein